MSTVTITQRRMRLDDSGIAMIFGQRPVIERIGSFNQTVHRLKASVASLNATESSVHPRR